MDWVGNGLWGHSWSNTNKNEKEKDVHAKYIFKIRVFDSFSWMIHPFLNQYTRTCKWNVTRSLHSNRSMIMGMANKSNPKRSLGFGYFRNVSGHSIPIDLHGTSHLIQSQLPRSNRLFPSLSPNIRLIVDIDKFWEFPDTPVYPYSFPVTSDAPFMHGMSNIPITTNIDK